MYLTWNQVLEVNIRCYNCKVLFLIWPTLNASQKVFMGLESQNLNMKACKQAGNLLCQNMIAFKALWWRPWRLKDEVILWIYVGGARMNCFVAMKSDHPFFSAVDIGLFMRLATQMTQYFDCTRNLSRLWICAVCFCTCTDICWYTLFMNLEYFLAKHKINSRKLSSWHPHFPLHNS